jgi:hypothetical protein
MTQAMLDLFAIAKGNVDAVQTAFEFAVAAMPAEQVRVVREFAAWVEAEALVSINVKLFVIIEFLNGGRYQNTYEWAREQARLSGRRAEDALRERLHKFYDRRIAFDRAFKNGEAFRYGALNAGGAGLPEYDPYCVVLTRDFQTSLTDVALLPGDSLKICIAADGTLDAAVVQNRTAPHTHRHLMAATERASEVHPTDKRDWAGLVASPGRYFEVIFIGDVALNTVKCVRVLKTEYERMWEMAFASFGRKLGDAERALVHDFVQMRRGVVDGKIQVEVVA